MDTLSLTKEAQRYEAKTISLKSGAGKIVQSPVNE